MPAYEWYQQLIRPSWAPPAWLFAPVWSFLYALIALSFGKVFYMAWRRQIPRIVALPFALNLVFNFAFTPIQFGFQNNILAAVDILFVLATLVWATAIIWPYKRWICYMQFPYLAWVAFATVLQLTVTYLNR